MPTLDLTADQLERIETLREEMESAHAGPYATVETGDVITYLCDLADAVDDPDRTVALGDGNTDDDAQPADQFPRETLRERLEDRNRRHGDPDDHTDMDLYTIAEQYDISGRSEMTKAELVDAILDRAAELYADPFALVDVPFSADASSAPTTAESTPADDNEPEQTTTSATEETEDTDTEDDDEATATDPDDESDSESSTQSGGGQLNAMLSLLDTHDDKWREADGDARYEVTLPDGTTETARTKDDVRALLFQHYR